MDKTKKFSRSNWYSYDKKSKSVNKEKKVKMFKSKISV